MSLTPEWNSRIWRWREELKKHMFRPVMPVAMEAYFAYDHIPYEKAVKGPFKPIAPGTKWGRKWEYGWFRSTVTIPASLKGECVELKYEPGGESLAFVNGSATGSHTWGIPLAIKARGGEKFLVVAESYGGHGETPCGEGPVPLDRETIPEVKGTQRTVTGATLGVHLRDAFQLHHDVQTLVEIAENIDQDSLRVADIHAGLRDFCIIVDFEVPEEQFLATCREARKRLAPLLAAHNGSTSPVMYGFGHAHLDVAWLWPLAETERKAARTLANQLLLARQYPEHRFLHSQAHLFRFVKTHYPELYARVRKAVASGTVIAEGGMWVEADTNVSGGEALIRQFIHGKRYFRDEFGVESRMLWLPDVFGYSGNMPQILKGCEVDYFATAKIFWNYQGGETFPLNTFWWTGIDGSRVLSHLMNDYNSQVNPREVIKRWKERVQKDGFSTRLFPFGWGDGGGGPTRDHLENARRLVDCEGAPRFKVASPIDYFEDQVKSGAPDVAYHGELYFQAHRGTYTTQARVKKGNRKSELALREAEMWACAASALAGMKVKASDLDAQWKKVLLCQFHDILPGSSIKRVYDEAWEMHSSVISDAGAMVEKATRALTGRSRNQITVFNSLSHERAVLVNLPAQFAGASAGGEALAVQKTRAGMVTEVRVPSCGWVTVEAGEEVAGANTLSASPRGLENELIKVSLNTRGEVTGIWDKQAGREITTGPCNAMRMYKDVPSHFDAWDIDSMYERTPVAIDTSATVTVVAQGPLVAAVKVVRMLNKSRLEQEIRLRRGSRRIDFVTKVDWQERHRLLKVAFPVDITNTEAVHEIQMGHLRRPTHRSKQYDMDRFEVCNHKWTALTEEHRGCALLNDCKYGINVLGNSMNLTLLRSPLSPDMYADRGMQEFTYSFYSWNGAFADSRVVQESYDLNVPAVIAEGGAGRMSLLEVDADNIVVETVKPAEDNSGDIVVRLYESGHMATACTLRTALTPAGVELCNMLEKRTGALAIKGGRMKLSFRPFEIKTVRFKTK